MSPTLTAALAWSFAQLWNPFAAPLLPSAAQVQSCLAAPEPSVTRIREDGVLFCGRIDADALARFRDALRPTDRALLIASFGGDLAAPVRMAELVHERALDVIVVGPCLSGCASFVFVAGRRRSIAQGGVLGLHNTGASALALARAIRGGTLAAEDRPLELRAAREGALYQSLGVDPRLLLEPQVRLETVCVDVGQRDARTGETQFFIHTRYGLWSPTRSQWLGFGVYFDGYAPSSATQAQRLIDAAVPEALRSGAQVTLSRLPMRAPPQAYLADVVRC